MSESVLLTFNSYPDIDEAERAYIASRGISPEKVQHLLKGENGNAVKCKITGFTKKNDIDHVNIQTRYINAEKNDRFKTLPGHKATGLFIDKIDNKKDYLLVVEGMFDFLSLRQFDTNVVGLFNAISVEAFDLLKYVVEKKNIKKVIYINDNDPAGIESGLRLLKIIESACLLDVKQFGEIKDVNDVVASGVFDYGIFLEICLDRRKEAQQEKLKDIEEEKTDAFEKVKNINEVHKKGMTIEFPVANLNTGLGLVKGNEMSIIIGSPNCGKTTFAFLMALHNLQKGNKVGFLSYEMPFGDIVDQYNLRRIPGGMDRFEESKLTDEDEIQLREAKEKIMKHKNFYSYDGSNIGIDDMKEHLRKMIAVGVSCIFIDNLIKIRWTTSEISDNQAVIEELFKTCHRENVSIILLHHTDKVSSVKNVLGYKGTSDVQIKPDNMFYLHRPGLTAKDEENNEYSKFELVVYKAKQRYGRSNVNKKESVYFYKGGYYMLDEFIQIKDGF